MVTCGVLVTDGINYLICHPTAGKWWDLPKGKKDPGESDSETAVREMREETGLCADVSNLEYLGTFSYRPNKDLCLFKWQVDVMPDPGTLHCTSTFHSNMQWYPEMDKFAIVDRDACLKLVNPSMCKVLSGLI